MAPYETLQAFLALNLDIDSTRRLTLATVGARSAVSLPELRWAPPTKVHVTLRYFADLDVAIVSALRDAMARLVSGRSAPRLAFGGFAAFPDLDLARVLYAETEDVGGATAALALSIDEAAEALGLPGAPRAFLPHLTLARSRAPLPLRALLSPFATWKVRATAAEVVLYRGETSAPENEYPAVARFAFGSSQR